MKISMGHLFEQYIGLELIRMLRLTHPRASLRYWSDPSGPEVDWVIESSKGYIPIEVKWTDAPTQKDAKHLYTFLKEYPTAKKGFILCQTPYSMKISENITAISWNNISEIFESL